MFSFKKPVVLPKETSASPPVPELIVPGARLPTYRLRLLKVKFDPTELLKVKSLAISNSTYAFEEY